MAEPADLSDDELTKVIETGVESEKPETPEPTEESPSETPEVEAEEKPEETPEQEEEAEATPETSEEKPPSRREQLRIQQLLERYGDPRDRQVPSQPRDQLDYSQALDADPEVIKQLQEDRQRAEEVQYTRGREESTNDLQYMQFYNNIRFDLPLVTEKLKNLDPVDAKALDDEYLAITGADSSKGYVRNPNIGYAEFIEARIEQAHRLASSMSAQTAKNIAQQTAQTGLRPDGGQAKRLNLNQAPENMTDEELYAVLGQKPPKK